jgi:radical SAM/Cys-rich protein
MHHTLPLLDAIPFPAIRRARLTTLQVNLGYRCNQACFHCHVNAGPTRTEAMSGDVIDLVVEVLDRRRIGTLDITGGAPELHPEFCNLTILLEPGQEDLAGFLAGNQIDVVASLPCYLEENVDRQRGKGVFDKSVEGLRRLNAVGYGDPRSGLALNLVYNPQGPSLPPSQTALESDYKRILGERYGVVFNDLFVLANMPIQRFGSTLVSKGQFHDYMALLEGAHRDANLAGVMCRSLVSVDYRGYLYDCDFNQMLDLPVGGRPHLRDLLSRDLEGRPIRVAGHCYGCTAGQGSSCGGALHEAAE